MNFDSFFLRAPSSEWLLLLMCAFIRIVASTRVRLHQKMVPISRARLHKKCLLFLLCAYIKMVPFSRVRRL